MADIIVQPKRFNGIDNDNLIIYQAVNATNATKINNLEIVQDQNGILKIGNTIIPQKQVLWSGSLSIPDNNTVYLDVNFTIGDIIEIEADNSNNKIFLKTTTDDQYQGALSIFKIQDNDMICKSCTVAFSTQKIFFSKPKYCRIESGSITLTTDSNFIIKKISKIIE